MSMHKKPTTWVICRNAAAQRAVEILLLCIPAYLCLLDHPHSKLWSRVSTYSATVKFLPVLIGWTYIGVPAKIRRARKNVENIGAILDPAAYVYPFFLPLVVNHLVTPSSLFGFLLNCMIIGCQATALNEPGLRLWDSWWEMPAAMACLQTMSPAFTAYHCPTCPIEKYEEFFFVLPLNVYLIQTLSLLCRSSLTEAELILLTTGLINLLLRSRSPQATILKALLWVGPLCLFIPLSFARQHASAQEEHRPTVSQEGEHMDGWVDVSGKDSPSTSASESAKQEPGPRSSPLKKAFRETARQAQNLCRSWALTERSFATYVLLVIVLAILLIVRPFVARYALNGRDPILWAEDYLVSDLVSIFAFGQTGTTELNRNQTPSFTCASSSADIIERLRVNIVGRSNSRLLVVAHWVITLGFGLGVNFRMSAAVAVDTRRKIFHGTVVGILLPTIFVDPLFVALTLSLVLAVFLLLELIRGLRVEPFATIITEFLSPYVDGRDLQGPIIVSHIFLLIGCAVPLWLSLVGADRTSDGDRFPGWATDARGLDMVSGVICVGLGDAAASLIGRRYGRHKWFWGGGKSLEGSAAFALAVAVGLVVAKLWLTIGWSASPSAQWSWGAVEKISIVAAVGSFTEAVLTGANDNIVPPIVVFIWIRLLDI